MPLADAGRNLAWKNAPNGKLTFDWGDDGNPKFNDDEAELVFSLLVESAWFGDQEGKRRSLISTIKTNDSGTAGQLVQYANDALQPAIDGRRLQSVAPSVEPTGSGYLLTVAYVTATGKRAAQTYPLTV